jgi:hypothetical protein
MRRRRLPAVDSSRCVTGRARDSVALCERGQGQLPQLTDPASARAGDYTPELPLAS